MRRLTMFLLAAALLGLSGAAFGELFFFEAGPDKAIFPEQQIPIYFDHAYHTRKPDKEKDIDGEGLSCTFCHEEVGESTESKDTDIPGHGSCDFCHDDWIGEEDEPAPVKECARCHTDLDPAGTSTQAKEMIVPRPNLHFTHAAHVEKEIECTECHKNVPSKTVATRDDYPTMDRCVDCHEDRGASTECQTCHLTEKDGRVKMYYANGEKLEPNRFHLGAIHDASFLKDHAVPAQRNRAYCDSCHAEKDCLSCHDGIARDVRYHPGDWIAVHNVRAKKDDLRCQSCHRKQTFCINCHLRSGVASVGPPGDLLTLTRQTVRRDPSTGGITGPHPMGPQWTGLAGDRGRNFHGFHAQRNIRSCVSCHQEQYCMRCHVSADKGGGVASFNPHGGMAAAEKLKGSAANKHVARACLKCHVVEDVAAWAQEW